MHKIFQQLEKLHAGSNGAILDVRNEQKSQGVLIQKVRYKFTNFQIKIMGKIMSKNLIFRYLKS